MSFDIYANRVGVVDSIIRVVSGGSFGYLLLSVASIGYTYTLSSVSH